MTSYINSTLARQGAYQYEKWPGHQGGQKLWFFDRAQSAMVPNDAFGTPNKIPYNFGLIDLINNQRRGRKFLQKLSVTERHFAAQIANYLQKCPKISKY